MAKMLILGFCKVVLPWHSQTGLLSFCTVYLGRVKFWNTKHLHENNIEAIYEQYCRWSDYTFINTSPYSFLAAIQFFYHFPTYLMVVMVVFKIELISQVLFYRLCCNFGPSPRSDCPDCRGLSGLLETSGTLVQFFIYHPSLLPGLMLSFSVLA